MKSMKSMIPHPPLYARPRFAIDEDQDGRSVEGDSRSSTSSTSPTGGGWQITAITAGGEGERGACVPSGAAPVPRPVRVLHARGGHQRSMNPLASRVAHKISGLASDLHSLCSGGAA